jgi:hypothetical protein
LLEDWKNGKLAQLIEKAAGFIIQPWIAAQESNQREILERE